MNQNWVYRYHEPIYIYELCLNDVKALDRVTEGTEPKGQVFLSDAQSCMTVLRTGDLLSTMMHHLRPL